MQRLDLELHVLGVRGPPLSGTLAILQESYRAYKQQLHQQWQGHQYQSLLEDSHFHGCISNTTSLT
jgi:hypothetical protein